MAQRLVLRVDMHHDDDYYVIENNPDLIQLHNVALQILQARYEFPYYEDERKQEVEELLQIQDGRGTWSFLQRHKSNDSEHIYVYEVKNN